MDSCSTVYTPHLQIHGFLCIRPRQEERNDLLQSCDVEWLAQDLVNALHRRCQGTLTLAMALRSPPHICSLLFALSPFLRPLHLTLQNALLTSGGIRNCRVLLQWNVPSSGCRTNHASSCCSLEIAVCSAHCMTCRYPVHSLPFCLPSLANPRAWLEGSWLKRSQ